MRYEVILVVSSHHPPGQALNDIVATLDHKSATRMKVVMGRVVVGNRLAATYIAETKEQE